MDESFIQERIAELRVNRGVSAREMSLSLGQSESYINTIENKKALPSMQVFLYICDYFKISPKDFFDTENKNPQKITELVKELNKLDKNQLMHISEIVKGLNK